MNVCNDAAFGPVSTCRFFDFTATFSNVILSILPTSVALVCLLLRALVLRRKPDLVPDHHDARSASRRIACASDPYGAVRVSLALIHAVANVVTLALLVRPQALATRIALQENTILASTILSLILSLIAAPISLAERRKTRGGAMFLPLWLFCATLFDACRVRTFAGIPAAHETPFFYAFVLTFAFKPAMLIAENSNGLRVTQHSTREGRASFFSRLTFAWLLPVLLRGYRQPLVMDDIDPMRAQFDANLLYKTFIKQWSGAPNAATFSLSHATTSGSEGHSDEKSFKSSNDADSDDIPLEKLSPRGMSSFQSAVAGSRFPPKLNQRGLLWSCIRAFPREFLVPAPWMVAQTACNLALPFLVSRTLAFAQSYDDSPGSTQTPKPVAYGWGLAGAYGLLYLSLSFATGQYWWSTSQLMSKIRGALIEAIYRKGLVLHLNSARKSGGGKAANLMSVDTERIVACLDPFHQLWSSFILIGIGSYMLYTIIGLAFLASLLTAVGCLAAAPLLSIGLGDKQKAWSGSTDARVNLTSSIVADIKGVKLSAYEDVLEAKVLESRKKEVSLMRRFWKQIVIIAGFTNLVGQMMELITFTTLILVDKFAGTRYFTLNSVITAITVFEIIQHPLMRLGQDYAKIMAALASVQRIEAFLKEEESASHTSSSSQASSSQREVDAEEAFAAIFEDATIAWNKEVVLRNVSVKFPANKLSMICGRLGQGKSTLLQALLGETDVLEGRSRLPIASSTIAYVSQDVWLLETKTIKQNILFSSPFWDADRYQRVLQACALDVDLAALAKGEDSMVKALSGGQRQRVAVARALYNDAPAYLLDDITSALDAETSSHMWRSLMGPGGLLEGKTVIMATNAVHLLHWATLVVRVDSGRIVEQGRFEELSVKGKDAVSRSSIDSQQNGQSGATGDANSGDQADAKGKGSHEEEHEEVENGTVSKRVYKTWARQAGIFPLSMLVLLTALQPVAVAGQSYLLQAWARANERAPFDNVGLYASMFALIILTTAVILVGCIYLNMAVMPRNAGLGMHADQIRGLLRAPLSYFSGTTIGRVTNRFSQDLFILDYTFPMAFGNLVGNIFYLWMLMITMVIPAPYLIVVCIGVSALAISLQRLYAPSSRQLRRLEMAAKSPLYSLFGEVSTSSGLATLRGLGRQDLFSEMNTRILNESQKPYYFLLAARRWLQTWLLLLSSVINVTLVVILVLLRHSNNVGVVGVALVQATRLSDTLNVTIVALTEAEIASVALERIQQIADIPAEEESATGTAKAGSGRRKELETGEAKGSSVSFHDVTIAYGEEEEAVVRGLSFSLAAGKRLGIVGRSGSGKSTTLLALFALLKLRAGHIEIDGLRIDEMAVKELRSMMTIVPQSPLVLAATVRENLDPEGVCEDVEIWDALAKCHLSEFVKGLPKQLEEVLVSGDAFLSAGQRQLLALARAILRKRTILVLDEATSAMDVDTDAAVREVLATQFPECTVIAVAHRIATIIDFDQIICMHEGSCVETGTPQELLAIQDGVFRSLAVEQKCA